MPDYIHHPAASNYIKEELIKAREQAGGFNFVSIGGLSKVYVGFRMLGCTHEDAMNSLKLCLKSYANGLRRDSEWYALANLETVNLRARLSGRIHAS